MEYRAFADSDYERVIALTREAFGEQHPPSVWRTAGRLLVKRAEVIAALLIYELAQSYGGRAVPVGGITSVIVAPECRGDGVGQRMMSEALDEMRKTGGGLSTLYPSTPSFYRRLGYEIGGYRTQYSCDVGSLRTAVQRGGSGQRVEVARCFEPTAIMQCYETVSESGSGYIVRSHEWWRDHVLRAGKPLYSYVARTPSGPAGYVILEDEAAGAGPVSSLNIACRELVWSSGDGLAAMLALLGGYAPTAERVFWWGPSEDPVRMCIGHGEIRHEHSVAWMSRLLSVPGALAARGYPPELATDIEFELDTSGARSVPIYRVSIANGRGEVTQRERTSPAPLRLDIGALLGIYTGALDPFDAVRLGRLRGDARKVERMRLMFAGKPPCVLEHF
jgi:predicted acetyltransferase